jgi:N-acetyl-S-(2-succino)cysteine monooxygenase
MTDSRKMILFVNALVTGHHEAAWRLPDAQPHRLRDIRYYQELAQTAERGGFDAMFVADFFVFYPGVAHSPRWELDPLTLMAGVACATSSLGLIATGSATFANADEIARGFSTLDHVSNGRAAWNIVTNGEPQASANYGQDQPIAHARRYRLGARVVDDVLQRWRGDADDAAGHAADRGAAVPRPVQGTPVLVQAGSSPDGRDFAARYADVVFTAQNTLADAIAFRNDMRERARQYGRDPDSLKVIPGIGPSIGLTDAQAREKKRALDGLTAPEASLAWLAGFGVDLSGADMDGPLPPVLGDIDQFQGIKSRFGVIAGVIERERPKTVRALLHLLAGSRGHAAFTGTTDAFATHMQEWFEAGGADGFMFMPHAFPVDLDLFVEHVSPRLRERGLLNDPTPGQTLRQRLSLPPR